MIKFRDINYSHDVPEIINLIHLGLSDKNTVDSFLWKHNDNPFGRSIGLLAIDEKKIVGVRMFMFWEFKKGKEIVKAIRPVDTIIHPNYRGKGLFKKLTLEGLEIYKNEYDLVFNTPNKNSFSGYIKMGWNKYPKELNFKFGVISPLIIKKVSIKKIDNDSLDIHDINLDYLSYRTNLSNQFLRWRYKDPDYKIVCIKVKDVFSVIVYRIERIKGIKAIILVEYIGDASIVSISLRKLASKEMVFVIHYLDNEFLNFDFMFSKRKGNSVVVYRDDSFNVMQNVFFSSGDLEGRI